MFQVKTTDATQRFVQYDGMIHYYKHGWFSNKWSEVYAKIWSDSTFEWFSSKTSSSPIGSVVLCTVIPYICVGQQARKIPTRKPKISTTWANNLLMAIATEQTAATVHWFYFDTADNLRKWMSEITGTLPRINDKPITVAQPQVISADLGEGFGASHMHDTHMHDTPNMTIIDQSNPDMMVSLGHRHPYRRSSIDNLFDETTKTYGLGTMKWNEIEISSDSDDDMLHHSHGGVKTIVDDVHVKQFDNGATVTVHSGTDAMGNGFSHTVAHPNTNEIGSGFNHIH